MKQETRRRARAGPQRILILQARVPHLPGAGLGWAVGPKETARKEKAALEHFPTPPLSCHPWPGTPNCALGHVTRVCQRWQSRSSAVRGFTAPGPGTSVPSRPLHSSSSSPSGADTTGPAQVSGSQQSQACPLPSLRGSDVWAEQQVKLSQRNRQRARDIPPAGERAA